MKTLDIFNYDKREFTILAVDDTEIFLDILEDTVSHMAVFLTASNGEMALSLASQHRPDIVLLDIEMPGLNGLEVAQRIKSNPLTEHASIIFITAHDTLSFELEAFNNGGIDFVRKPINRQALQARVRTHIALISKSRQLKRAHNELAKYIANLNVLVSYWSHDLVNVYSNDTDGKWFNKKTSELIGTPLMALFAKSDYRDLVNKINDSIANKRPDFSFSFTNYQGQNKYVNATLIDDQAFESEQGFLLILSEAKINHQQNAFVGDSSDVLAESLTVVTDAVLTFDVDKNLNFINRYGETLLGAEADALLKKNVDQLLTLFDIAGNEKITNPIHYASNENKKNIFEREALLINPQTRSEHSLQLIASPVFDKQNSLIGTVLVMKDITEKRQKDKEVFYLTNHDPLTNLPNRTLIIDRTLQAIKEAKRSKASIGFLLINIDSFTKVNDNYGYATGDKVLKSVASILQSTLRECDSISRQNGDEFIVMLPMIAQESNVVDFCSRIRSEFGKRWVKQSYPFNITLRIGAALFPEDANDVDNLFKRAETAMQEAKRLGGDNIHCYSAELESRVKQREINIAELERGIARKEFIPHYQPKVDSKTSEVLGFEALARWQRQDGTMLSPDRFIPLAEETKLIIPIGKLLLQQACIQVKNWQQTHPKLQVSVNVSAIQFNIDFIKTVKEVLAQTGVSPGALELEITESVLLNDKDSLTTFNGLKELGVKISIDDFGTGYSSLSYIKKYALDVLKIDQSFVRNMLDNDIDITIIKTIVSLARNLNVSLVAEGVETEEHAEILKGLGCHLLQGYFYGRPVPADEVGLNFEAKQKS